MWRYTAPAPNNHRRRNEVSQKICAWCNTVMDDNYPTKQDSHGICPECAARLEAADELVIGSDRVILSPDAGTPTVVADEIARMAGVLK